MIKNFVQGICGCKGHWTMTDFAKSQANTIVAKLGNKYCIGAVSGGVDCRGAKLGLFGFLAFFPQFYSVWGGGK